VTPEAQAGHVLAQLAGDGLADRQRLRAADTLELTAGFGQLADGHDLLGGGGLAVDLEGEGRAFEYLGLEVVIRPKIQQ